METWRKRNRKHPLIYTKNEYIKNASVAKIWWLCSSQMMQQHIYYTKWRIIISVSVSHSKEMDIIIYRREYEWGSDIRPPNHHARPHLLPPFMCTPASTVAAGWWFATGSNSITAFYSLSWRQCVGGEGGWNDRCSLSGISIHHFFISRYNSILYCGLYCPIMRRSIFLALLPISFPPDFTTLLPERRSFLMKPTMYRDNNRPLLCSTAFRRGSDGSNPGGIQNRCLGNDRYTYRIPEGS